MVRHEMILAFYVICPVPEMSDWPIRSADVMSYLHVDTVSSAKSAIVGCGSILSRTMSWTLRRATTIAHVPSINALCDGGVCVKYVKELKPVNCQQHAQ